MKKQSVALAIGLAVRQAPAMGGGAFGITASNPGTGPMTGPAGAAGRKLP
jgi:hypothetical protein